MSELTEGLPVEIYWNLHKRVYSVRHRGIVIAHTPTFFLRNVRFAVQAAGRKRALREGRKNVHAFIRGDWSETNSDGGTLEKVTYNPFKYTSFMVGCPWDDCPTLQPIHFAPYATGTSFERSAQLFVVR